jgi:hypothetical protein
MQMKWTRLVAHMRETVNMYRILVGKLKGDHFENLGVDVQKILKLILKK